MKKKYNTPEINPFTAEYDEVLTTLTKYSYGESKETTFNPSEVWDEE